MPPKQSASTPATSGSKPSGQRIPPANNPRGRTSASANAESSDQQSRGVPSSARGNRKNNKSNETITPAPTSASSDDGQDALDNVMNDEDFEAIVEHDKRAEEATPHQIPMTGNEDSEGRKRHPFYDEFFDNY